MFRSAPRPRLFLAYVLVVIITGLTVLAVAVGSVSMHDVTAMRAGQVLALVTCLALIVLGEIRPVMGSSVVDPLGVTLSTTFVFPVLLHFGLVPAVLLHAVAAILAGLVGRRTLVRNLFNVAQYALSATAGWLLLAAVGIHPTLSST